MKLIYGISIWFWIAGLAALLLAGGLAAKNWKVKPTENGEKCLDHAKRMILAERSKEIDHVVAEIVGRQRLNAEQKEETKAKIREAERMTRAYEKSLSRLKEEESFFRRESEAVEKWVREGREKIKQLPRTERGLKGVDGERLEMQWEIFVERDMMDLLSGDR